MYPNYVKYLYFSPSFEGIFKGTLLMGVGILDRAKVRITEEEKNTFSLAQDDKHLLTLYRVEDADYLKEVIWHGKKSFIKFTPTHFVPVNHKTLAGTYKLSITDYINPQIVANSYVSYLLRSRGIKNLDVDTFTEFVISPGRFCQTNAIAHLFDDVDSLLAIMALTLPSPKGADPLSYWTYRWNLL